jgi:hypothetical protein
MVYVVIVASVRHFSKFYVNWLRAQAELLLFRSDCIGRGTRPVKVGRVLRKRSRFSRQVQRSRQCRAGMFGAAGSAGKKPRRLVPARFCVTI